MVKAPGHPGSQTGAILKMIDQSEALGLLRRMATSNVKESDALRSQLQGLATVQIDEYGSLSLEPSSGTQAGSASGVFVDAEAQDVDGIEVYALLHVRDGWMYELQFYRGDGRLILGEIHEEDFRIVSP